MVGEQVDCVVIATDHSSYDWDAIIERARLVVDTRHATECHKARTPGDVGEGDKWCCGDELITSVLG